MFLLKKLMKKIALSSNDDKRMQSIELVETYAYGTSKDLINEKEEIKCNSIIKPCKSDWLWWCYKRKHKRT